MAEGSSKKYDRNGLLGKECNYENARKEGPYKRYENGKLIEEGYYENDKKSGPYKRYDENGDVIEEGVF